MNRNIKRFGQFVNENYSKLNESEKLTSVVEYVYIPKSDDDDEDGGHGEKSDWLKSEDDDMNFKSNDEVKDWGIEQILWLLKEYGSKGKDVKFSYITWQIKSNDDVIKEYNLGGPTMNKLGAKSSVTKDDVLDAIKAENKE